jgi:phospholipid/cholesterol/gamma-HCH transport system permease protein
MSMAFVEKLGTSTLTFLNIFYEALYFGYQCLFKLLHKRSYNSATQDILIKQIYFTAVQVLPLLFLIGVISGIVIVALIVNSKKKAK